MILAALTGLEELGILQRGQHIAQALRAHLPSQYAAAIEVLLASLTPELVGRNNEMYSAA